MFGSLNTSEQEKRGRQNVYPAVPIKDSASGSDPAIVLSIEPSRTSSLRQNLGHKRGLCRSIRKDQGVSVAKLTVNNSLMIAEDESSDASNRCSSSVSERPVDVGRVDSWASSFNKLLEDPIGLHMFSEFLKKEFSQENLTFWVACEHYRLMKDPMLMAQAAKDIYSKHLCIGSREPVNVDSHARQVAGEGLESPSPELFLPAQNQIFNLMKFDCYQRFLKSSIFKECMLKEVQGKPLSNLEKSQDVAVEKPDASRELRKKSLIPWHKASRGKFKESTSSGSKLKACKASKKKPNDFDDIHSELGDRLSLTSSEPGVGMMSSQESLNSVDSILFSNQWDADYNYCRVILPNLSTTVVRTCKGETLGDMLLSLLEKRSLAYNAVEAYIVGSSQPLDHSTDVTSLCCKEIKVEQVILFCIELPNKKTIGVKSKSNKKCIEILKPVLLKYGYKVNQVRIICKASQQHVSMLSSVNSIDNQRILIREIRTPSDKSSSNSDHSMASFLDLEELTNQIFDDLLKNGPHIEFDGLRVIDYTRAANNGATIALGN